MPVKLLGAVEDAPPNRGVRLLGEAPRRVRLLGDAPPEAVNEVQDSADIVQGSGGWVADYSSPYDAFTESEAKFYQAGAMPEMFGTNDDFTASLAQTPGKYVNIAKNVQSEIATDRAVRAEMEAYKKAALGSHEDFQAAMSRVSGDEPTFRFISTINRIRNDHDFTHSDQLRQHVVSEMGLSRGTYPTGFQPVVLSDEALSAIGDVALAQASRVPPPPEPRGVVDYGQQLAGGLIGFGEEAMLGGRLLKAAGAPAAANMPATFGSIGAIEAVSHGEDPTAAFMKGAATGMAGGAGAKMAGPVGEGLGFGGMTYGQTGDPVAALEMAALPAVLHPAATARQVGRGARAGARAGADLAGRGADLARRGASEANRRYQGWVDSPEAVRRRIAQIESDLTATNEMGRRDPLYAQWRDSQIAELGRLNSMLGPERIAGERTPAEMAQRAGRASQPSPFDRADKLQQPMDVRDKADVFQTDEPVMLTDLPSREPYDFTDPQTVLARRLAELKKAYPNKKTYQRKKAKDRIVNQAVAAIIEKGSQEHIRNQDMADDARQEVETQRVMDRPHPQIPTDRPAPPSPAGGPAARRGPGLTPSPDTVRSREVGKLQVPTAEQVRTPDSQAGSRVRILGEAPPRRGGPSGGTPQRPPRTPQPPDVTRADMPPPQLPPEPVRAAESPQTPPAPRSVSAPPARPEPAAVMPKARPGKTNKPRKQKERKSTAGEREILAIHERNKDIITGERPDAWDEYTDEADGIGTGRNESYRQPSYSFIANREGKSNYAEIIARLPRNLHNKVRLVEPGTPEAQFATGNTAMTEINTDAMVDSIIQFADRGKRLTLERTAEFVERNPEMFSPEEAYAVAKWRTAQGTPTAESAKIRKLKPEVVDSETMNVGDKMLRVGEQYRVTEIDPDSGAVTIKDGETYELPPGTAIAVDQGTYKPAKGKKRVVLDDSFDFGFNAPPPQTTPDATTKQRPPASVGSGTPLDMFGNPEGFLTGQAKLFGEEQPRYQAPPGATPVKDAPKADPRDEKIGKQYDSGATPQMFPENASVAGGTPEHGGKPGTLPAGVVRRVPGPELVKLATNILGSPPAVRKLRGALGRFSARTGTGQGRISVDPGQSPHELAATLAHEIGHAVDWLPTKDMRRGNLLGRLFSLHRHMRSTFGETTATNGEIRKELKELSAWWRPWDEAKASKKEKAYRNSGKELYADALSVLLNSPGDLQARAPRFYQNFFRALDRKPTVRDAYLNIQDMLNGVPEELQAARRADVREGFASGEEVMRARQAESEENGRSVISMMKQTFFDRFMPTLQDISKAIKKKIAVKEAEAARYALDSVAYRDATSHAFLSKVQRSVWEPLAAGGVTYDHAGEYLAYRRMLAERAEIPNPYGHTPETAQEAMANLRAELGEERFKLLEQKMNRFNDIVFSRARAAVDAGVYGRKTFDERIAPNKNTYSTFAVVDYLDKEIPAGIREQVGTFKPIANPFVATLMKQVSLNRAIDINLAKLAVRDFYKAAYPGEINKVPTEPGSQPRKPGHGKDHLVVMENGAPVYYEIDKYVAQAFQHKDIETMRRVADVIKKATYTPFHALYVTLSPGWQAYNIQRDLKRTYKNMAVFAEKGAKAPSFTEVLGAYWKAKGPAWRRARRQHDPLIEQMMRDKEMDVPFASIEFTKEDMAHDRLLRRYGMDTRTKTGRNSFARLIESIANGVETMGVFQETLPKVATHNIAVARGLDPAFRSHVVRNYVGTPNFKKKGLATHYTNGLFMYSNVILQGLRADAHVATNPSTAGGYWMRSLLIDFMPKIAMGAASAGLFGEAIKRQMALIPTYAKEKYIVIPLGMTYDEKSGQEKAVWLQMPHDDVNRPLAAMMWKAFNSDDWTDLSAIAFGELPGLSPPINMANKWRSYLSGNNPYDDFRGRNIIGRDEFDAGGWYAAQDMLSWTADQFGVLSTMAHSFIGKPGAPVQETTAEKIVGSVPGLSRIVNISDRGMYEDAWAQVRMDDAESARLKLKLDDLTLRHLRDRYALDRLGDDRLTQPDRERRILLNSWYKQYLSLTEMIALGNESERKQFRAMLKEMSEQYRELISSNTKAANTGRGQ